MGAYHEFKMFLPVLKLGFNNNTEFSTVKTEASGLREMVKCRSRAEKKGSPRMRLC